MVMLHHFHLILPRKCWLIGRTAVCPLSTLQAGLRHEGIAGGGHRGPGGKAQDGPGQAVRQEGRVAAGLMCFEGVCFQEELPLLTFQLFKYLL